MTFYNTTGVVVELNEYRKKAKKQDDLILLFFQDKQAATPSQVWTELYQQMVPITSVRRSITNLTNDGKLIKTDKQQKGVYGRPEYVWRIFPYQQVLL